MCCFVDSGILPLSELGEELKSPADHFKKIDQVVKEEKVGRGYSR